MAQRQTKEENRIIQLAKTIGRQFIPNVGTLLLVGLLLWAQQAGALSQPQSIMPNALPGTITYQGKLTDEAGTPITGTVEMVFALYELSSGGTALWSESYTGGNAVQVQDGEFTVHLGSVNPISSTVWITSPLYLGVQVGADPEMMPREEIGSVPTAMIAQTVPDGSITNAKLNLQGNVDLGEDPSTGIYLNGDYPNIILRNTGGHIRLASAASLIFFLDADNNSSDAAFRIGRDNGGWVPPVAEVFKISEDGYIDAHGTLNMHGNPIVNQGSMIGASLQTPDQLASDRIDRFSEGDVLCWGQNQLELCSQAADPLVQAVASEVGKPIIMGAEVIKVLGPVQRGDLLVASDVPGYAMADNDPRPGTVIAQALEDFDGVQGLIKAMIRKF